MSDKQNPADSVVAAISLGGKLLCSPSGHQSKAFYLRNLQGDWGWGWGVLQSLSSAVRLSIIVNTYLTLCAFRQTNLPMHIDTMRPQIHPLLSLCAWNLLCHINLQLVGFLAFCPLSCISVYIMVSIALFKSAACTELACSHQLHCPKNGLFPMFV